VRSEVNLPSRFTKKIALSIPVVAAAMDTVSEAKMAVALGKLGGVAVLHRNCTVKQQVVMLKQVKRSKVVTAAACGPLDIERAKLLDKAGADSVVIDCAHAHNVRIIKSAKIIRKAIRAQLVIGNIATREAAREFAKFADALKVGIGPGSICTTRVVAGIGIPQLTAILEVVEEARKKKVPVIADGGIKYSGDIVKAFAAGASTVMLGSLFAGTDEAPGRLVRIGGERFKAYRGMGSIGAMQIGQSSDRYFQKRAKKYVPEGVEALVPYKGRVSEVVEQLVGGLRSGMGYLGAWVISDMPKQARFIRITNAGLRESHPHSVRISKKAPNY
jgi:IMP dehydrogenase